MGGLGWVGYRQYILFYMGLNGQLVFKDPIHLLLIQTYPFDTPSFEFNKELLCKLGLAIRPIKLLASLMCKA